jgi:hypothetical protein
MGLRLCDSKAVVLMQVTEEEVFDEFHSRTNYLMIYEAASMPN